MLSTLFSCCGCCSTGEPVDEGIIEDGVALSTKAKTRNLTIDSDVVRGIGQVLADQSLLQDRS